MRNELQYEQHKASEARRYARLRMKYRALKEGKPCVDCGGVFPPECMDYDHRDKTTKSFNIAKSLLMSEAKITEEIAKCDLVCANCHRIRTYSANFN